MNTKKKTLCLALVLIMCLSFCTAAFALIQQARGGCAMSHSGRTVSFSGYSDSAQTEDTIGVTVILWELRGTTWYEVARSSNSLSKSDFVDTAAKKTVSGGHYYKVSGTYTSTKNGTSYSGSSETTAEWIS